MYFSIKGSLTEYIPKSQNLLTSDLNKNINNFIHRGKANVLKFLEKLPKTKHDFGSFIIDVPFASVSLNVSFYFNLILKLVFFPQSLQ